MAGALCFWPVGVKRLRRLWRSVGHVDALDANLEDPELLAEVELTTALMVAANQSSDSLSDEMIDRLLGIASASGSRE